MDGNLRTTWTNKDSLVFNVFNFVEKNTAGNVTGGEESDSISPLVSFIDDLASRTQEVTTNSDLQTRVAVNLMLAGAEIGSIGK